ncbi:MAG: restriction endonuclease subunit S, partial [Spirochaetales bacterium]|nr:restriction endonuclease subunit S [Spirochaetales bacterium]
LGKVAIIRKEDLPLMLNTSVIRFRSYHKDTLLQNFIKHFLTSDNYYSQIIAHKTGSAIFNYGPSHLKLMSFPLPPLNEQKRIVAKLDAIMPRIDSVKARLDKVPVIIKRFRQSVLTAAVTGKLTEKWREEHNSNLLECKLEDVIIGKPRNGYSPKSVKYKTSVKSLTLTATTTGIFNEKCFKYIDEEIPKDSHLWLETNDILIQRSNSINYVGISAIYPGKSYNFIYPDLMMKVKANIEKVLPKFLLLSLQSYNTLDYFRSNATGTAGSMPKINQSLVMRTPLMLPPLEEQKEIVRQVDKLFALADKLEAHYQRAKAKVDKLSQSVLAKAFRGELVPQDPNDEPAEKLLERIMEEKDKLVGSVQKVVSRRK